MSNRQLQMVAAVLVALAAALVVVRWNASRPTSSFEAPFDMKSLDRKEIDKVTISGPEGSVALKREGASWSVEGSPAATETVNRFWKAVNTTSFDEVVSTNPANYESFGVAKQPARTLTFLKGKKKKAQLLLGNPADTPESFYARAGGGKEVWRMAGELSQAASVQPQDWTAKPK